MALQRQRARLLSGRVLLALIPALLGAAGCQRQASGPPVRNPTIPVSAVPVRLVPLDRTLALVGTLFPKDEATVGAEVEGRVERTWVEFGDRVTNRQDLARIDTTSYLAQADVAKANTAKARAALLQTEQELRRVQLLRKEGIGAPSDLDKAVADEQGARAELQASDARAVLADLAVERSRARAPFDAAVAERLASAGDYVKVGSPLFRIVNDSVLKFITQSPERFAGQLRTGQVVRFTVDAWPGMNFTGRVYLISPSVSLATRGFNFGALVPNADRRLKAGTYARGEVVFADAVPTRLVPVDAIVNFAGVTKVFVISNNVARARTVTTGRVIGDDQEILRGVEPGEPVAVTGVTKLFDGATVKLDGAKPSGTNGPAGRAP